MGRMLDALRLIESRTALAGAASALAEPVALAATPAYTEPVAFAATPALAEPVSPAALALAEPVPSDRDDDRTVQQAAASLEQVMDQLAAATEEAVEPVIVLPPETIETAIAAGPAMPDGCAGLEEPAAASAAIEPVVRWPRTTDAAQRDAYLRLVQELLGAGGGLGQTIAVTGACDEESDSRDVVLGLGLAVAERCDGAEIVVDADFAARQLARRLRLGRAAATERLPESDWQAELHATDIERLRFLPAAHRVGGSVAAWDARLARELDAMRAAGYVVLLHLPRSALLRAPATLQHCDGVCLAVRLGEFRASELTAAAAAIAQCGGRLAACAALAAA